MNGPAWPLSPVLGQVFKGWVYDSRTWRRTRGAEWTVVQRFTASGQYTPSEDLIYAVVECFGAGGGGGWAQPEGVSGTAAAGGGGSGGYSRKTIPAELLADGVAVFIAAGGIVSAGSSGGGFAPDTTFGVFCIAKGGGNANCYDGNHILPPPFYYGNPGPGAPMGTGDVTLPGACGEAWSSTYALPSGAVTQSLRAGVGGALFGGNARNTSEQNWPFVNQGGSNGAPNSGAGGTGGQIWTGGAVSFGGVGGSGLVIVTEICGTDSGVVPPVEPIPPGWPPGVPRRVDAKVALKHLPPDAPWPPRGKPK